MIRARAACAQAARQPIAINAFIAFALSFVKTLLLWHDQYFMRVRAQGNDRTFHAILTETVLAESDACGMHLRRYGPT